MLKFRVLAYAALVGLAAAGAGADTLQMGQSEFASYFEQPGKPTRGMSQASVEAQFGAPQSRRAAVGDPPISRWEYANFVVFFEYDKVIHAVSKR